MLSNPAGNLWTGPWWAFKSCSIINQPLPAAANCWQGYQTHAIVRMSLIVSQSPEKGKAHDERIWNIRDLLV